MRLRTRIIALVHSVRNIHRRRVVLRSNLFSPAWYCARYPDVVAANLDPLSHYLDVGGREGRAPSMAFDGARYLADYPDVTAADSNPLLHYLLHGRRERRSFHPLAAEPSVAAMEQATAQIAFCTVVDTRNSKRDLAYGLVASWHRYCSQWSSLHVVLVGEHPEFSHFAQRLGARVVEGSPHPLADRLVFANKWLLSELDIGAARAVVLDWDMVFVGDPWLLRALPGHCFGARPAPALRLSPELQRWAMAQFGLPRGINMATMEVVSRLRSNEDLSAVPTGEIMRQFRYYNGGLLVIPPGRLRDVMSAWQAAYEMVVERVSCTPEAASLPMVESGALNSDQLALAIALAWENVYPLDPTCNFFVFDYAAGYSSGEVSLLHLAGPISGTGPQALLTSFEAQLAPWRADLLRHPRFDPSILRGKLEALIRDYAENVPPPRQYGGKPDLTPTALQHSQSAGGQPVRPAVADSVYDEPDIVASSVQQGSHREIIGGLWEQMGELQLNFMKENGLRPEEHLLDIGCGSLRGGVRLAAYLDRGHYWGVDSNGPLLEAGRAELELAGISYRVPGENLLQDAEFDFNRLGQVFDRALAQSLFTHLPANRIRLCLYRLAGVMRPYGRLFATYFEVAEDHPIDEPFIHPSGITSYSHKDPFHYRPSEVAAFPNPMPWRLAACLDWGHPRNQKMMVLERLPSE